MAEEIKNLVDKILAYETGEMEKGKVLAFFQELVNTGLAWKLQGSYGRMAARLIETGEINQKSLT